MFNDILFEERHRALVALLLRNDADVICLQEVHTDVCEILVDALEKVYKPVSPTLLPPHRIYGEMIFVRNDFVINNTGNVELPSAMGRCILHTDVTINTVMYTIATFHLESLSNQTIRQKQLKILWDTFVQDGACKTILCGDTNMRSNENVNLPKNIIDVWQSANTTVGEYTYWGNRYWSSPNKERYDKLWCTDDLILTGFGVLGSQTIKALGDKWISDHDGLYIQLAFKEFE